MKKIFAIFWILFILYFVFVHPSIIYYNTSFLNKELASVHPSTSFLYLGMSLFLWLALFVISVYLLFKNTIMAKYRLAQLIKAGTDLNGQIVRSKPGVAGTHSVEVKTQNLQNETISHTFNIRTKRNDPKKYQVGKPVRVKLDPHFKSKPYVAIKEVNSSFSLVGYLIWALFLLAATYYFYFSYQLESNGFGWRFLEFWHPLVLIPLIIIALSTLLYFIFKHLIFKNIFKGKQADMLKFLGKKTVATITDITQTGVYINDQPQVKYSIEFEDQNGRKHQASIKKIVRLIDIGNVRLEKEKNIFYLPDNPDKIAFEEDLLAT